MGREERVFSIHHQRLVAVYIYGRTNVMESVLCKMELLSRGVSIKVWTIYCAVYM